MTPRELESMTAKQLGIWGENYAIKYYKKCNYSILAKNWRYSKKGEIDIIAKKGETIVFIEVKTRRNFSCGTPIEAISNAKYKQMLKCAQYYISHNALEYNNFRIDVIAINANTNKIELKHIKNAMMY